MWSAASASSSESWGSSDETLINPSLQLLYKDQPWTYAYLWFVPCVVGVADVGPVSRRRPNTGLTMNIHVAQCVPVFSCESVWMVFCGSLRYLCRSRVSNCFIQLASTHCTRVDIYCFSLQNMNEYALPLFNLSMDTKGCQLFSAHIQGRQVGFIRWSVNHHHHLHHHCSTIKSPCHLPSVFTSVLHPHITTVSVCHCWCKKVFRKLTDTWQNMQLLTHAVCCVVLFPPCVLNICLCQWQLYFDILPHVW